MNQVDAFSRAYLGDNEICADAINFLCFNGKQIVMANDLSDDDTRVTQTLLEQDLEHFKARETYRDLLMRLCVKRHGLTRYAIFGIENQTRQDSFMTMRSLEYSVQSIRKMLEAKTLPWAEGLPPGKVPPVVTIVVYWSPKPWTAPRDFQDYMHFPYEALRELVPKYRLNLIEPCHLTEESTACFRTSLGTMLNYARLLDDDAALAKFIAREPFFARMSARELALARALGNFPVDTFTQKNTDNAKEDENMDSTVKTYNFRKGFETLMDRLAARTREEVSAKCKAEERRDNVARLARQMRQAGLTGESGISLLMKTFDLTREQAVAMLAG